MAFTALPGLWVSAQGSQPGKVLSDITQGRPCEERTSTWSAADGLIDRFIECFNI